MTAVSEPPQPAAVIAVTAGAAMATQRRIFVRTRMVTSATGKCPERQQRLNTIMFSGWAASRMRQ